VVSSAEAVFEPDYQARQEIAVDETKIEIDGTDHYVWAAVDYETLELIAFEVFPGRSSLGALLILKHILERCHGRPLVRADREPWYDCPPELLDCEHKRETW